MLKKILETKAKIKLETDQNFNSQLWEWDIKKQKNHLNIADNQQDIAEIEQPSKYSLTAALGKILTKRVSLCKSLLYLQT